MRILRNETRLFIIYWILSQFIDFDFWIISKDTVGHNINADFKWAQYRAIIIFHSYSNYSLL